MFTRFFGKSSFFSYALALGLFVGVYFFHIYSFPITPESGFQKTVQTFAFFLLLLLFLGLDWIVRIQYWNQKSIYHLFLFCLLFFLMPLSNFKIWELMSLLFFWIGFIQILGLDKTNSFVKSVFNGALWMIISGLFVNAYFLLFPLVWGVLWCYSRLNIKSFLITLLPAIALGFLGQLIDVFIPTPWLNTGDLFHLQRNIPAFSTLNETVLFLGLMLFFIVVSIYHYRSFSHRGAQYLSSIFSLFLVFFSSLGFVLFFHLEEGMSLFLLILTFSALSGAYVENIKRKWIRELILFFLLGIVLLFRLNPTGG